MTNKDAKTTLLKIGKMNAGGMTVLTPESSVTYQNCQELKDTFDELIEQQKIEVILECKSISYIDSKTLELLWQTHDELRKRGGVLKMTGLNAVCRDILLATRVINIFDVYQDIHEAIKSKR